MKNVSLLLLAGSALLLASCGPDVNKPPVTPDTTKPTVTLTATPATVTAAGTVTLKATASDNVGVTKVTFYRGTTQLNEDTTAPYEATDSVTAAQNGTAAYRAVASDAAGNTAEASANVTVNIANPVETNYNVSGTVVEGEMKVEENGAVSLITTPWTGGAGSVIAATLNNADQTAEVTRTTLAADGKFSLDLPALKDEQLSLVQGSESDEQCTGMITVSDKQARGNDLMFSVDAGKDGDVAPLTLNTVVEDDNITSITVTAGSLTYVDRNVTIQGAQKCSTGGDLVTIDINVTLQKGWNKVSQAIKFDASGETHIFRSGSFPTDNWVYLNDASMAQPLSTQGLKLKVPAFPFFR